VSVRNTKLEFFLSNFLIHCSHLPERKSIFGAVALKLAAVCRQNIAKVVPKKWPLNCVRAAI